MKIWDVIKNLKKIFIKMRGGLGNQLFMLAYVIGLKKKDEDVKIIIDNSDYEHYHLRNFELLRYLAENDDFIIGMDKEAFYHKFLFSCVYKLYHLFFYVYKKFGKKIPIENIETILRKLGFDFTEHGNGKINYNNRSNTYVYGYFQDYKLVDNSKDDLLKVISNPSVINKFMDNENVCNLYNQINKSDKNLAVSMRCGSDYVSLGWPICTKEYYLEGIKYFVKKENINTENIFIFSDEISEAKKILMEEFPQLNYVNGLNPTESLFVMSLCDNFIISNSSFAWWGQELSSNKSKKVIAPSSWFNNNDYNCAKIYRNNFHILDNEGKVIKANHIRGTK
ncbi:alpha-1,2-fucosyltransferase [Enterococcus sp. ARL09-542]|nr:alpha-1,2-fucosyltransferase [Enterococcus sp. ARL09-542]